MRYQLERQGNGYGILNRYTDYFEAYLHPLKVAFGTQTKFSVRHADNYEEIALVTSLDEAIPALVDYYERNLPWDGWHRGLIEFDRRPRASLSH